MLAHRRTIHAVLVILASIVAAVSWGCARPPASSSVELEIVEWSLTSAEHDVAAETLRLEGTVRMRMRAAGKETDVILSALEVRTTGGQFSRSVTAEEIEGDWPAHVTSSADTERTVRFVAELWYPSSPEGFLPGCVDTVPLEATLEAYVLAAEDDYPTGAGSPALPVPLQAAARTDWGFRELAWATTSLASGISEVEAVAEPNGAVWLLAQQWGEGTAQLVYAQPPEAEQVWQVTTPETKLRSLGELGALVITGGPTGRRLTRWTGGAIAWSREVSFAYGPGQTATNADRVVMVMPADSGVLLEGTVAVEPAPASWAWIELDAFDGSLIRSVVLPTEIGLAAPMADGATAVATNGPGGKELILFSSTLEERFRLSYSGSPSMLVEGPAAGVIFVADDFGRSIVGRITSYGTPVWSTVVHGTVSGVAPLPTGGALVSIGPSSLAEIDQNGNVIHIEEVACDAWLSIAAGSNGDVLLAGLVGDAVRIDGTSQSVPFPEYRALWAVRRP